VDGIFERGRFANSHWYTSARVFIVHDLGIAVLFCVVTMLGWGSWANTQKLAGKDKWPFELFYWDYAIGVFAFSLLFALTLGSAGASGMPFIENLRGAPSGPIWTAIFSGVLFNISNILLVVGIDAAGMAVAFPVGVGLALVIGTVKSYIFAPQGNAALLTAGVVLIVFAMVMSALAHHRLKQAAKTKPIRGLAFSAVAGCLMGFFYPELVAAVSPDFSTRPLQPGLLTPYTALVLFAVGLLASNIAVNTIFMRAGKVTYGDYFRGRARLHSLGFLGGCIWMLALCMNVIASGVAGPAISYALGQGATLVAAIWGVFIWREFMNAPKGTWTFVGLMFAGYVIGLVLIGMASL
jgi:glucose uptake protein